MFNWLISPMHNTYHQNDNNKKPNDLHHWAWWRHKRTIFIRCIPFKNPSRLHLDFWRNLRRGDLGSNPGFHEVLFHFFPNLDKFGIIAKVNSSIFIVFLHVGMREWPGSLYEQNKFILPCKTLSSQVKTSTRNSKTLNREQLSWRNATTFMQFIQWSWLPMRVKHEAYLPG